MRALFLTIAVVAAIAAALSTGGAKGFIAIGLMGYAIVVFGRDHSVLQRATILLYGSFGAALIARGLPGVVRNQFSLFLRLNPLETLTLGTAFFVGAILAYPLFVTTTSSTGQPREPQGR